MKSRMDRYYNANNKFVGRTTKNENLYKETDYSVYSSNETIIDTNNEIDITKLKDIIKSREDYQRAKSYRNMLNDKKFDYDDVSYEEDTYEEKDYDINALLDKVKKEKNTVHEEDKYRKLRNTQYDILSNLDIKNKHKTNQINEEEEKQDLQGLIDSITHKTNSNESKTLDPTDLLSDLKAENTMVTDPITEDTLKEKEIEELQKKKGLNEESDTSFYSDSFSFSKKDFEGFQDLQDDVKSNNILIKILIFILVIIILTIGVLILDYFYHFIPFM